MSSTCRCLTAQNAVSNGHPRQRSALNLARIAIVSCCQVMLQLDCASAQAEIEHRADSLCRGRTGRQQESHLPTEHSGLAHRPSRAALRCVRCVCLLVQSGAALRHTLGLASSGLCKLTNGVAQDASGKTCRSFVDVPAARCRRCGNININLYIISSWCIAATV